MPRKCVDVGLHHDRLKPMRAQGGPASRCHGVPQPFEQVVLLDMKMRYGLMDEF